MSKARYIPTFHRLALLTAAATFPLIFMGGLVTSHGAGMSVPDWPNSYGYNMFTFPPSQWVGGILYEHTHRLMGTIVGMMSIAVAICAWRLESRAWVRRLAYATLGAVVFQGVLGGLRVIWVNLDLAIVHACFAQAFFCLAALAAIATSRWWIEAPDLSTSQAGKSGRLLVAISVACLFAIYAQLIVGAVMRHERAGLAIPDLPLAYGQLIPPTTSEGLTAINQERAWTWQMDPVTLGHVWLHFGHRLGAILVSVAVITTVGIVLTSFRHERALVVPAIVLGALLLAQLTLGVLTVVLRKPADIATLHVAVGALVLVCTFTLCARSVRLYARAFRSSRPESVNFAWHERPAHASRTRECVGEALMPRKPHPLAAGKTSDAIGKPVFAKGVTNA